MYVVSVAIMHKYIVAAILLDGCAGNLELRSLQALLLLSEIINPLACFSTCVSMHKVSVCAYIRCLRVDLLWTV